MYKHSTDINKYWEHSVGFLKIKRIFSFRTGNNNVIGEINLLIIHWLMIRLCNKLEQMTFVFVIG